MLRVASFTEKKEKLNLAQSKLIAQNYNCIMPISVGQKYHEGRNLDAIINLINSSGFSFCLIMVADKLQRYNKQLRGMSIEESEKQALKEGDEWIQRNSPKLAKIKTKYKTIRWDEWLMHESFADKKVYVEKLCCNSEFKNALEKSINRRLGTERARNTELDMERARGFISPYIMEEAVVATLWEDYHYVVYPSDLNPAMEYIFQEARNNLSRNVLQPLIVKFENVANNTSFFNKDIIKDSSKNNQEDDKKSFAVQMVIVQLRAALALFNPQERNEVLARLRELLNSDCLFNSPSVNQNTFSI